MKILFIHVYYTNKQISGVNQMLYSTIDTLNKGDNEAHIFATDEKPYIDPHYKYQKFFPKSYSRWDKKGIKNYIKSLFKYIYNKEAKTNLDKLLDEFQPDIVHIHSVWELTYSIIEPIKKRNIPIVYTAHDPNFCCPGISFVGKNFCNKCKGLNTLPCILNKCGKNNFFVSIYFAIKALIERMLCPVNYFEKIIVPSKETMDFMSSFGISKEKFIVNENFLPKEDLIQEPNYQNMNYFLYAGGLNNKKGVMTLLKAMSVLPKDIKLHIVGNEDRKCQANDFIKNNNLNNVKYLGILNKEQIQEEYKNCISVIMPSECFETFGMINIEAAVYGKPSISSNIGGLPDVVEDGKTGLIFEPGNVEQLKECILKYWNNRDLAIEHGKAAREKTLNQYNEDLYFKKLIKIYEKVINNAK